MSWEFATTPSNKPLSSIYFKDNLHGWAVGGTAEPAFPTEAPSNIILETKDGGLTWFEIREL